MQTNVVKWFVNKGGLSSLHKENISIGKKAFWENDQRANELCAKSGPRPCPARLRGPEGPA